MITTRKKLLWILLGLLSFILLLVVFYQIFTPKVEKEKPIVDISRLITEMSTDDLAEESDLILSGRITKVSEPIIIRPLDSEEPSVFCDYEIQVVDIYRGSTNSDTITLRLEGGELENVIVIVDSEPAVEIGETYTFFLHRPIPGGRYTTQGDYYLPVGAFQGMMHYTDKDALSYSQSIYNEAMEAGQIEEDTTSFLTNAIFSEEKQSYVLQDGTSLFSQEGLTDTIDKINEELPPEPYAYEREIEPDLVQQLEDQEISETEFREKLSEKYPYAEIMDVFPDPPTPPTVKKS